MASMRNDHEARIESLVIENRRLRAALKKLADEADLGLVTDSLMQEVSDLTGVPWVKES